jgi:hypothetical protein
MVIATTERLLALPPGTLAQKKLLNLSSERSVVPPPRPHDSLAGGADSLPTRTPALQMSAYADNRHMSAYADILQRGATPRRTVAMKLSRISARAALGYS